MALDASIVAVDAVFNAVFKDGLDTTNPAVLESLGRSFGIDDVPGAIATPEVKQRLRANTDAAIARGVFGVPTIALDGELFWGEDSSDMLLDFVQDRTLFAIPEMQRLKSLPTSIVRREKPAPG